MPLLWQLRTIPLTMKIPSKKGGDCQGLCALVMLCNAMRVTGLWQSNAMGDHLFEPWEEGVDGVGCRSVRIVNDVESNKALMLLVVGLGRIGTLQGYTCAKVMS